jgi:cation transport regulator ChaB/phage I-like protein
MPYNSIKDLPENTKNLPLKAKQIFMAAFNQAMKDSKSDEEASKIAWSAVGNAGFKKKDGQWIKAAEKYKSIHYVTKLSEIKLSGNTSKIEIMRVGSWNHKMYGPFSITEENLEGFVKTFNDKVRGIDIAFDLEHGETVHAGAAVGWVKSLEKKDGSLLAEVAWTELGLKQIKAGTYKYFSPEFMFDYTDDETGKTFQDVLLGGSLTNRPFIKNMDPVLLSEEVYKETLSNMGTYIDDLPTGGNNKEEDLKMKFSEKIMKALKLSENATEEQIAKAVNDYITNNLKLAEDKENLTKENKKLAEEKATLKTEKEALDKQIKALADTKTDVEKKNIALAERVVAIEGKMLEAEYKVLSDNYIKEGKMTPAMAEKFKEAYMKDKDATVALMETLQPVVKLGENGSSQGTSEYVKTGSKRFLAEVRKIAAERKVTYREALSLAESEKPELFILYENERGNV